ncbi:SlyX family protein [Thalassotalea sp. PLHSN55]|uniref:SlyX family protein n=1 Tax=Thalassotalea sp. PLHSN55 TaxID=3435888 RepID=UPI003F83B772
MADKPITQSLSEIEQHIEALESRNAFQDDVIEQLNHELAIHQAQISELKTQLKLVAERIKDHNPLEGGKAEQEPPPPHY